MKLEIRDDDGAFEIANKLLEISAEWKLEYEKRARLAQWAAEENDESYLTEPIGLFLYNGLALRKMTIDTQKYILKLLDQAGRERAVKLAGFLNLMKSASKQ